VRRLIVNADDLGLHPGISTGAVRAFRDGIVTSVSVVANGAAFDEAVRAIKECPTIGVGVHLTLVGETPLLSADSLPTLAPRGRLPQDFVALFARLCVGRVRLAEIEQELAAQVARLQETGLRITHMDSHQHVHLHPQILPIVLRLAARFDVHAIRAPACVRPVTRIRPALLTVFTRRAQRLARRCELRTPDTLLGLARSGRLDEDYLVRLIARLPPGSSELVCHPGQGDGTIAARYRWGFRWDDEAKALTSPRVREALEAADVRLINYARL
jgi:chitin disaccharide deacetylase